MSRTYLKPMSGGEILDAAFSLYRHHFLDYTKIALIAFAPSIVMTLFSSSIANLLMYFAQTFALIAVMKRASGHLLGEDYGYDVCFKTALRKWFPIFAASMLVGILISFGFLLLVVPGVLLIAVWFAYQQVLVLENDWAFPSRSTALAKGAWTKILLVKFVSFLILMIPGGAIGVASVMMQPPSGDPFAGFDPPVSIVLGTLAVSVLTTPFKTLVDTMLYYERRVAVEGLDVELAARGLAQGDADASGDA